MVRWTVAEDGDYKLEAGWRSLNADQGRNTTAYVVHNGVEIHKQGISGLSAVEGWSSQVTLAQGDVLDFVVDDGFDGYGYDSTGVRATLSLPCP